MTQPEALRLADLLEPCCLTIGDAQQAVAAAELRRLSAVEAQRDALLEALKEIDSWLVCSCIATAEDMAQSFPHMQQVASAAIKQAEENT